MSLSKSFLYNTVYQISLIVLPFITIPYVTRVLGSSGVGLYSFTDSILNYFVFFAMLGVSYYGSRAIAYVKDDFEERSKSFLGIFFLKLITTTISSIIFFVFLLSSVHANKLIYFLQFINLLSAAADISWFFIGIEEIKTVVTRNVIIKIISVALIFVMVKHQSDVWIYVLILTGSNFLGQLIMWKYVPKKVKWVKLSEKDISIHFVPILKLFILQIAAQLYMYLDKTMLGIFSTTSEVGIYDMSQKLVRLSLALITSMSTVMIPRISNLYIQKDMEKIKTSISKVFQLTNYISIAIMFGLCGIIKEFAPWFFGPQFLKVIPITYIVAPMILIVPLGHVVGVQLMIPMGKELLVSLCPITAAVINAVLNVFLIPRYFSIGAGIASLIAEFVGATITVLMMRKFLPYKKMFSETWKYLFSGILMLIIVRIIGNYMGAKVLTTLIQGIVGVIVYVLVLFLLRSEINKFAFEKTINGLKSLKR